MWRTMFFGLTLLLLMACGGGEGGGGSSIAQWAAQTCAAAERLADAEDVGGGVDPTTLTLEERQQRAAGIGDELTTIFDEVGSALKAIDPPASVENYHEALIGQAEALSEAVTAQTDAIGKADSSEDIEAANAELNIALERTEADIAEAAEDMPREAVAALRGVNNCGNIVS